MEINSNLRVSTMTLISRLSADINLEKLFNFIETDDILKYIEWRENTKGEKKEKNIRKKKSKRNYFYNQITAHFYEDKIVNVKIFNNGRIQMTGLKTKNQGLKVMEKLLVKCMDLEEGKREEIFSDINPQIKDSDIVLINSDFDAGFKIKRENLQRLIISQGYYSSFEPTIYPGVNIKYYFNKEKQVTGICNCCGPCNGKGKDGLCKKITVAVFNSGKIIITGGQSYEHLNTAYDFITEIIEKNKNELIYK